MRSSPLVQSTVQEIEAAASDRAEGRDDFGAEDYRAGLEVLLEAARTSPHAGPALDRRVRASATTALASRLWSEAGWRSHPDYRSLELAPQVVVVGLPRSGTTALHQILAADTRFQWIPAWLAPSPGPRPPRKEWATLSGYQAAVQQFEARGPNPLHDVRPDDPEECLQIMQQSFVNMTWVSSQAVPDYHEWFVEQDERPSYRRYADNLRLIGMTRPDARWLLKNPSHTFGLAAMLDEFPDATFVHIYRDPVETIVSGCSLIASMGLGDGTFTPRELGAHRLRIWALAADRMDEARAAAPARSFVDVDYRAFVADPVACARGIYRELGLALTAETEAAMQAWQESRPRHQYPPHRYEASDFGLTASQIRDRMAGYIERYGVGSAGPASGAGSQGFGAGAVSGEGSVPGRRS